MGHNLLHDHWTFSSNQCFRIVRNGNGRTGLPTPSSSEGFLSYVERAGVNSTLADALRDTVQIATEFAFYLGYGLKKLRRHVKNFVDKEGIAGRRRNNVGVEPSPGVSAQDLSNMVAPLLLCLEERARVRVSFDEQNAITAERLGGVARFDCRLERGGRLA